MELNTSFPLHEKQKKMEKLKGDENPEGLRKCISSVAPQSVSLMLFIA